VRDTGIEAGDGDKDEWDGYEPNRQRRQPNAHEVLFGNLASIP